MALSSAAAAKQSLAIAGYAAGSVAKRTDNYHSLMTPYSSPFSANNCRPMVLKRAFWSSLSEL